MAKMVFAAYRRDDFADPDTFLVQLGMVLERYSDDVIRYVTHPATGIQRRCKFPPTIAEVAEACDAEAAAIATRKRYHAMGSRPERESRSMPRADMPAGHLANLLIRPTMPGYQEMVERARDADRIYWRQDVDGIHVPFGWYDDWKAKGGSAQARRFTMADLDAIVERADAEAAE